MAPRNFFRPQLRPWLILLGIWLVTVFCDRVWWGLDHQVPAWDQADYLNGALNYWRALQTPDWFNSDWWREFWLLSTKIPPLNYILTALTCFADGTLTLDRATWLFAFYAGALFVAIFQLGVLLFSPRVGLWAVALCALMPGLVRYRLDYVLDFPVTAGIIVSFAVFTCLHLRTRNEKGMGGSSWLWAIVWGISFGLALLIKQTAVLFLLGPMLGFLWPWRWRKLGQLLLGLFVTATLAYPWFRTNWLLVLTGSKRATIDSAIAEGDPSLLSLDAWTYYLKVLSMAIAWPIWIFVGLSLLWFAWRYRAQLKISSLKNFTYQWRWLSLFLLSGYFLSSLNINKDPRYVLPLLPIVCLVLARAWIAVCDHNSWLRRLSFVALGLTSVLWLSGSFSLGNPKIAKSLNPIGFHRPYLGEPWSLPAVIAEIVKSDPLQQNTLGVLPSTPTINQHNVSFYGAQADFRVFGRQVGTQAAMLDQDLRSLDWFLLKTGDQGSIPETQSEMVELVQTSPEFAQHWQTALPDGSELQLYHRRRPSVTVEPVSTEHSLRLEILDLPTQARPGRPVPVTYRWLGPAETLANGLVLLDWRPVTESGQTENSSPAWIHDHGFGMGYLRSQTLSSTNQSELATWRVIERTAMLPPPNLSGSFQLTARYLDSQSGETHSIPVPANTLALSSATPQSSAPELDLGTQLRQLAPNMAEGDASLDRIFTEIGRINQYDPTQDYLRQLIQTLKFRLRSQQNPDWLYAVTLAQVLRQDPLGAIATLTQLAELSPENPFVYAYLSFLYLYNWQPRQAQQALLPAEQLAPELEIIQILGGASRLLQGNIIGAWKRLQPLLSPQGAN